MKKWMKWVLAIMCVANGALFVVGGNWSALLWMIFACLCLYIVVLLDTHLGRCHDAIKEQYSYIEDADEHINYLVGLDMFKELKKAECWRTNCERALKNMVALKEENRQLKILNRNLLHNQEKGVKKHARGNR
jgi:hypothetical protein